MAQYDICNQYIGVGSVKVVEQRGVVLIVVLWITVLLTVLLVAFTATVKVDRNIASDIVQRVQARAGAEAVLSYLVAVRQSGAYDWSEMTGQVYKLSLNTMQVRFRFIPESAFISLNAASVEDLETVFNAAGAQDATAIAEYIVQRREGSDGSQTGEAIEPRPWVSSIELSQLPYMTADVYQHVQGWFTVDSDHQGVNVNFAEADLIRALKGAQAEQILVEQTEQGSENEFAEEDGGDVFRVQVELSSTANKRKIEASVAFGDGELGYRIARWNEYNAHFSLE